MKKVRRDENTAIILCFHMFNLVLLLTDEGFNVRNLGLIVWTLQPKLLKALEFRLRHSTGALLDGLIRYGAFLID